MLVHTSRQPAIIKGREQQEGYSYCGSTYYVRYCRYDSPIQIMSVLTYRLEFLGWSQNHGYERVRDCRPGTRHEVGRPRIRGGVAEASPRGTSHANLSYRVRYEVARDYVDTRVFPLVRSLDKTDQSTLVLPPDVVTYSLVLKTWYSVVMYVCTNTSVRSRVKPTCCGKTDSNQLT